MKKTTVELTCDSCGAVQTETEITPKWATVCFPRTSGMPKYFDLCPTCASTVFNFIKADKA